MSMFLSRDELRELTGLKQKSKQIEWLKNNNISHKVSSTGYAVVVKENIFCANDESVRPNFEALING